MHFAAIEVRESEAPHTAIGVFMRESAAQGSHFKRLEVLRMFGFGTRQYAHIKTDCKDLPRIVKSLQPSRAMVIPTPQGRYRAYLPGGKEGEVPHSVMQAVAGMPRQRVYRGTAVENWERQFLVMPISG
jgi:hypothetical protein